MNIFKAHFLILILLCLPLLAIAGRKLSDSNCQCGVKLVRDNVTVSPWIVYVHRTISSTHTATCAGVVLASNIILTSRQCLQGAANHNYSRNNDNKALPTVFQPIRNISVTDSKQVGEGTSYPVLNVTDQTNISFVMIQVGLDFSSRESNSKPVCLPTRDEPNGIIEIGTNLTYFSAKTGAIPNLAVKKGQDCDLKKGAEGMANALCVTFTELKTELEVGQPLFIEIRKNPNGIYPIGFYTYLAGLSTSVHEGKDGQKHLFFTPVTSILEAVESLACTFGATWCSQPWPWLNSPEKVKRDKSLDCECGIPNEQTGRIFGGEDTLPYEFPWMVMLSKTFPWNGRNITIERSCGGTIINDRMILTATHCIIDFRRMVNKSVGYDVATPNETYTVHLHAHLRSGGDQEIEAEVVSGLMHPGFTDGARMPDIKEDDVAPSGDYDIALLILTKPLNFSATDATGKFLYRPACLPRWGEKIELVGREGIALGWGYNSSDPKTYPDPLQKTIFTLKSAETCFNALNITVPKGRYSLICSNHEDTYVLQGDSGGPTFVKDESGKHTTVGITSFGEDAARGGKKFKVSFMANVQELLPFVDYHADLVGAKYCKK